LRTGYRNIYMYMNRKIYKELLKTYNNKKG
jgi:hypothetical protein